jgi:hypothetical protein
MVVTIDLSKNGRFWHTPAILELALRQDDF